MKPRQYTNYTFRQICEELELRDIPSLNLPFVGYIQNSHVTDEQLLSIDIDGCKLADTVWVYEGETSEWIPVFRALDVGKVLCFMDVARDVHDRKELWITPKGFPREQFVHFKDLFNK